MDILLISDIDEKKEFANSIKELFHDFKAGYFSGLFTNHFETLKQFLQHNDAR